MAQQTLEALYLDAHNQLVAKVHQLDALQAENNSLWATVRTLQDSARLGDRIALHKSHEIELRDRVIAGVVAVALFWIAIAVFLQFRLDRATNAPAPAAA